MTNTWPFDQSFLVFLVIVFLAQACAVKLRSIVPMPLVFGAIFMVLYGLGWLPVDMLLTANMTVVGTIAFHLLVIHSGTMIDLKMLMARKSDALICITGALVLVLIVGIGLQPVLGRGIAFLSPGSVAGGGASCAIASRWVLDKNPEISVFPWMIFMFQGIFSVPVVTLALKKEAAELLRNMRDKKSNMPESRPRRQTQQALVSTGLCGKIPPRYKTTAYYLGSVMMIAVLNRILMEAGLENLGVNSNVTAVLLGIMAGNIGAVDRAPLFKSDAYGLLLLGLMGLMANTIANTQIKRMLALIPIVIFVLAVSTIILIGVGLFASRVCHFRKSRGIILTMNCVMGFPVNDMLVKNAVSIAETEEERCILTSQLRPLLGMGTMLISNGVSIFIVSIMTAFI